MTKLVIYNFTKNSITFETVSFEPDQDQWNFYTKEGDYCCAEIEK